MDTSETYIKMCEKAEEIQHSWRLNAGDWMLQKPIKLVQVQALAFDQEVTPNEREYFIWLPRQDQLQAMVYGLPFESSLAGLKIPEKSDMWTVLPHLLSFAYNWEFKEDTIVLTQGANFYSMEQLWLAFVMKEKYNKTWNGEDWTALK